MRNRVSFGMDSNRLDIVVFGATGFTGKHVVKVAAQFAKEKQIKFGVAGRRRQGLEAVVKEFAPDIENVPIIIADVDDKESLEKMTEQAKVLINCCGPYRFCGEAVVKACIATHTDHVDVSGEPWYMEKMQLEYNEAAQKAGVYIISACGFDSIPCDLGVIFTQEKFNGEVNSIESYLSAHTSKNISGAAINYQTYASLIYGIANMHELRPLRTKLFSKKLPALSPKLKRRAIIHRSPLSNDWATVFLGADRSVALRSQRFLFEKYQQRPAQVQTYLTVKSLFAMMVAAFFCFFIFVLSKFEMGRNVLLKYPRLFSGGYVSHEGPSQEAIENTHFTMTFKAKGWAEKLAEGTDKHMDPPNKEMVTKVSGTNPGYGITSIGVVLCAMMILKEFDKMPHEGGVLPPGAAFAKTSLIEELNKNGLTFEVVSPLKS